MQDSKKGTDVYNGLLDSEGEGEGGMIWENGIQAGILPTAFTGVIILFPPALGFVILIDSIQSAHFFPTLNMVYRIINRILY